MRLTGWTLAQIDDTPAWLLDELLAVDQVHTEVDHWREYRLHGGE